MRAVRRHRLKDARAGHAPEGNHDHAASCGALVALIALGATPYAAHGDWVVAAQAGVRHDDNVGNAQNQSDIVGDSALDARLSMFRLYALDDGYTVTVGGDLGGEAYRRLTGLDNASLDGMIALKKKWGLGAFAPWARAGFSAGRSSYSDSYRNAWDYRAALASGRRIDERWNLWGEYAYERRAATPQPELEPGLSGDAFGQNSHNAAVHVEYSMSERMYLAIGVLGRHGDVVSTTSGSTKIYDASQALAEDPAFGPEAYAYKLTGTTFGLQLGINYSLTVHSVIGCGFERFDTRADGGNNYTKSIAQITWNYLL